MNRPLTARNHTGLALAAVLGLVDLSGFFMLSAPPGGDAPGPPPSVLLFCAVMGVVTLVAVAVAWARRRRAALRLAAGSRVLSALTAVPAFFVPGVPALLVAIAAASIVLALVGTFLMLSRARTAAGAAAEPVAATR